MRKDFSLSSYIVGGNILTGGGVLGETTSRLKTAIKREKTGKGWGLYTFAAGYMGRETASGS